jgi:hypothetical protein
VAVAPGRPLRRRTKSCHLQLLLAAPVLAPFHSAPIGETRGSKCPSSLLISTCAVARTPCWPAMGSHFQHPWVVRTSSTRGSGLPPAAGTSTGPRRLRASSTSRGGQQARHETSLPSTLSTAACIPSTSHFHMHTTRPVSSQHSEQAVDAKLCARVHWLPATCIRKCDGWSLSPLAMRVRVCVQSQRHGPQRACERLRAGVSTARTRGHPHMGTSTDCGRCVLDCSQRRSACDCALPGSKINEALMAAAWKGSCFFHLGLHSDQSLLVYVYIELLW